MNCREVSSLLSLYLDHELDDLRRKRVDLHAQKCPACSHDLATLAKTVRVIRAAAGLEPDGPAPLRQSRPDRTDGFSNGHSRRHKGVGKAST